MLAYLQKVFRVLPEEGGKLFQFALFAALLQAGVVIGLTAADSLFLTHLGAERLPVVYLFMPVAMMLYAPVYSLLLAKFGIDRLVQLTLGALVVGGVFFGASGEFFPISTHWLLYAMKFYVGVWFIALYTLFWNFTNDYFNLLDGKRLFGLIAAGSAAGSAVGAMLVSGLSAHVPPDRLFFAWAILALLTLPVFAILRRRYHKIELDADDEEKAASPWQLLHYVLRMFRTSRFALALTLICFCAANLTALLEYLSMSVLSQSKTPAELAHLLGKLNALASGLTLVVNLVFFSRIVGWLGVANTALILPLTYLAAFVFFYLKQGPAAAILAFYAYQSILPAIEYNNANLLYNALPARVKPHLRTFVEAMAEPMATAFAGVFLLSWATGLGPENVALAGLLAACGALGIALIVKFDYVTALAGNLRREWLNFGQLDYNWSAVVDESDRVQLREKAAHGTREQRLVAVDLLVRVRDPQARSALLALASNVTPPEMDRLRPAVSFMLRRDDTETLAETLLWLESEHGPNQPEVLDEFTGAGILPVARLQEWKYSRQPAALAATAVARWQGARLEDTAAAIAIVHRLLAGSPAEQRWALRAIGDFGHARHATELLRFLDDPDPGLRLESLRALRKLASPGIAPLLVRILPLVAGASSEERHLILGIVERADDTKALGEILWAAEHFSAADNRHLEVMIVGLGLKTIPTVIHVVRDTSAPYHSRSVAARALSRLAMPQLLLIAGEIVDTELNRARDYVMAYRSLAAAQDGGDGLGVLTRFYHDGAIENLELALELLSLVGQLPDFDLIRASLSVANAKDQANALETIQQTCSRSLYDRILFLVEQTGPIEPAALAGHELLPVETVLRQASVSDIGLECSAAFIGLLERRMPGGGELLRARLEQGESPRLSGWLTGLLPYFAGGATQLPLDHLVTRVAALLRAPLFRNARVLALDYLAQRASERRWPPGTIVYESGEPTDDTLCVLTAGTVELTGATRTWTAAAGEVFGERVLLGDRERRERAVATSEARALALPATGVARAIEIFPALGISLYRFKTISAVA